MSDAPGTNHITLLDNSEKQKVTMAEGHSTTASTTQSMKGEAPGEEPTAEKASWYGKPEDFGNSAGDAILNTLSPVGHYAGKGLETLGRPVGGMVEPLVGGIMKGGKAFGEQAGVGFGNAEGGPAQAAEAEKERTKKPVGGAEQTADNPLGLTS